MAYKNYKDLLTEIKSKVREAQLKTVMAANAQMLLLYWQMGNYIIQNQQAEGWGAKIIEKLGADLKKEFPELKGFSPRNLLYMKQFAEAYPVTVLHNFIHMERELKSMQSISQQAVAKLLRFENEGDISAQPLALLQEELFLQSIISRISWSQTTASVAELQSIATMEAMASGLPVIAADAGALNELVHDGINGYLFQPGDINAISEAICCIIGCDDLCLRMKKASLKLIDYHSIQKSIDQFEQLYKRCMQARSIDKADLVAKLKMNPV